MPGTETETAKASAVGFECVTPILSVKDLNASVDYYTRILGFKLDWNNPGIIASVSRDRKGIMLCEGDQGHPGGWVWIGVEDSARLYQEYVAAGARIRHKPTNYLWAYEFQAEDPDGNVLRFASEPRNDEPEGEWLDMQGRVWVKSIDGGWRLAK